MSVTLTRATPFLGAASEKNSLEKARFLVLPVPYEKTTSYKKGTELGPAALLEASCQLELWDEELKQETWKQGIYTLPPLESDEEAAVFFPKLTRYAEDLAQRQKQVLFAVGGEHSLTQALVPPYVKKYPKLSVLHFDAHADLRAEYEGSPHNHACALYPASRLCPVVQVGIRSAAPEELVSMNKGRVKTFFMHEYPNIQRLIPKVLQSLTQDVYISVDLDGFDPSVIPGVGTPQPGGFLWQQGLELFKAVISAKNVVAIDIMELCPLKDTVISEFHAAKLVYRLMGYLTLRKTLRSRKPIGSRRLAIRYPDRRRR